MLALNDDSTLIVINSVVVILGSSVDSMVLKSLELAESVVVANLVVSWVCGCVFVDSGDVAVISDFIVVCELVVNLIAVDKIVVTDSVVVGESIVEDLKVVGQLVVADSEVVDTSLVGDDTDKVKFFGYKIEHLSKISSGL